MRSHDSPHAVSNKETVTRHPCCGWKQAPLSHGAQRGHEVRSRYVRSTCLLSIPEGEHLLGLLAVFVGPC
jgi:hypothetical protein